MRGVDRNFASRLPRFVCAALLLTVAFVAWGGSANWQTAHAQSGTDTLSDPNAPATEDLPDNEKGKTRTMLDTLMDGGLVGVLILLLSMVSVGFIVEHFISIRNTTLMPEDVTLDLEEMIRDNRIEDALKYCEEVENQSLISNVIHAGLERYKASKFGAYEYRAALEEAGEDQTGKLYRKTEVLNLVGSIAPMLGLTGTVIGMIDAFNTIASSGGMAKPDELAGGIGKALVTTLMGLVVAIPTMVAFSYFRNKIDSIVAEAGKRVEQVFSPLAPKQ